MARNFVACLATVIVIYAITLGMVAVQGVDCSCVYGNCECYFS